MRSIIVLSVVAFAALASRAQADQVPSDCMVSFKVKENKISTGLVWALATGTSAAISCSSGELLRERLFVEGNNVLRESDLTGTPTEAQKKAQAAFDSLEVQIKNLPGEDVKGTIFTAGGYVISKHLLASCILTAEDLGGTCWVAASKFLAATYSFFQKVYKNENDVLVKRELLTKLESIRPVIVAAKPDKADPRGARLRWVETQTNLCRAIQRDCL